MRRQVISSTRTTSLLLLAAQSRRSRSAAGPFSGASPIPEVTLEWDGLDAAGRRVIGDAKAILYIEFRHRNLYVTASAAGGGGATGSSFGGTVGNVTPVRAGRSTVPLIQ